MGLGQLAFTAVTGFLGGDPVADHHYADIGDHCAPSVDTMHHEPLLSLNDVFVFAHGNTSISEVTDSIRFPTGNDLSTLFDADGGISSTDHNSGSNPDTDRVKDEPRDIHGMTRREHVEFVRRRFLE